MKAGIRISLVSCICFYQFLSYSDPAITSKDLKNLVGCWKGSITYLDYTSNKPFSMPANIIINDFKRSNTIICSFIYPEEPAANSRDTLHISNDGRSFNNETITVKRKFNKDSIQLVTAINAVDGNDNKSAIIRHSYLLGRNTYSIKKEVQFAGETNWILRNEYKFTRMKPCN